MIYIYLYVHGGGRFLLLLPSAAQSGHIAYKKGLRKARGLRAAPFIRAGLQEPGAAPSPRCRYRSVLGVCRGDRAVSGPQTRPGDPRRGGGHSGSEEEEKEEGASGL